MLPRRGLGAFDERLGMRISEYKAPSPAALIHSVFTLLIDSFFPCANKRPIIISEWENIPFEFRPR